jgi:hypothetical protein
MAVEVVVLALLRFLKTMDWMVEAAVVPVVVLIRLLEVRPQHHHLGLVFPAANKKGLLDQGPVVEVLHKRGKA